MGRIYALTGEREKAGIVLERLKELDGLKKEPDKYVSPTEVAILYVALGMRESAFESLERAVNEKDLQIPVINVEPEYDTLRDDPRFSDLLCRIKLKNSE